MGQVPMQIILSPSYPRSPKSQRRLCPGAIGNARTPLTNRKTECKKVEATRPSRRTENRLGRHSCRETSNMKDHLEFPILFCPFLIVGNHPPGSVTLEVESPRLYQGWQWVVEFLGHASWSVHEGACGTT